MKVDRKIAKINTQIETIEFLIKKNKGVNVLDKFNTVLRFLKEFKKDLEDIKNE